MNILISFCYVLLIFDPPVRSEDSEHDSIKKSTKIVKRLSEANSENNIIYDLNNDDYNGMSTTTHNIIKQGVSPPNIYHFQITPGYNEIPRKTLHAQRNSQIPLRVVNVLNATRVPIKVPVENKNHNYIPFVFLLNDTKTSHKTDASGDFNVNKTFFTQNNSVTSTNEIKDIPTVETTTKSENKEENIGRSTVNVVVTENNVHKHNHKHHRHHDKIKNKTIESSTDVNLLPKKDEVPIDNNFCKNKLEDDKRKEDLEMSKFLNLHLKLSHVDAWNEINCEPIENESTLPINDNYNTILTNNFSAEIIEIVEPPTVFEDMEIIKFLNNQNLRNYDCNNLDFNNNPDTIENQLQKGSLLYSELRPGFDKGKLNKKMFNNHQYRPQNNIKDSYYQQKPYNYYPYQPRAIYQHQRFTNIPVKLNKNPLILPPIYKMSGNNEPYEFNIPSCYDRELKNPIYQNNDIICSNDEPEINRDIETNYDSINEIIELVNNYNRQLNDKLQEYRISERYNNDYHFDEVKDDVEHLKVTKNWNDALKDIERVKNDDFENWYKRINYRPLYNKKTQKKGNNRMLIPKRMYRNENSLSNPSFSRSNDYLGPDLEYERDPEIYDEVRGSCRCS